MAGKLVVLLLLCVCLISVADAQKKKKPKRRVGAIVKDMEKNMTELWKEVKTLSQPVHVHIHGDGHVMGGHEDEMHDHFSHCHGKDHDHHEGHGGQDHEGHDHESHGHEGHDDKVHDHSGHDHSDHNHSGHDHEGHGHKDHKHGHKDHDHKDHDHDDKGKKKKGKKGHHDDDKMKGGHEGHEGHEGHLGHGHMHEEDDEFHHGEDGTHVHIHLHTAFEKMMRRMEYSHGFREFPVPTEAPTPVSKEYRYARCDVSGNSALPLRERQNIRGSIFFRQMPQESLQVKVNLQGFVLDHRAESSHMHLRGIHGHTYGDMSNGCNSMGGHYNPHGVHHGGPEDDHSRHPGDFGNLQLEEDGTVMTSFADDHGSLFGDHTLLGRGIVIHQGADDHGKGGNAGSKASGNAGKRIACCAIVASAKPDNIWEEMAVDGKGSN